MPREKGQKVVARNKKALHDYHIGERVEAGMVLTGTEVKSLRAGRASLVDAFATIDNGEVWLRNAHIPEYEFGTFSCGKAHSQTVAASQPDRQVGTAGGRLGTHAGAVVDLLLRRVRQGRTGRGHRQERLGQAPDDR